VLVEMLVDVLVEVLVEVLVDVLMEVLVVLFEVSEGIAPSSASGDRMSSTHNFLRAHPEVRTTQWGR